MAVLEKIRVKLGVFISVIIALALLSFIIDPSTLETALNSMSSKYDVGEVAGKKVSYTDFQSTIDKYTTINELMSGSSVQNEEAQTQIRNAAWQEYVDKYMFSKNAKDAGIIVGDSEFLDLLSGDNLSPLVAQNAIFLDENGAFSVEALNLFIQQVNADETGRLKIYWDFLQNNVLTQQYYSKYNALFTSSNFENALQLNADLAANNTSADIEYVLSSYPFQRDSTIEVSDNEVRAFYNSHKESFKQKANREIEYVVFEVVPSESDINATSEEFSTAYEEFLTTDAMKTFLLKNSDRQLSNYYYKEGELNTISAELNTQVFNGNGTTQIIKEGNTFLAARVVDTKKLPDQVFVKHILLNGDRSQEVADSLVKVINKGENFSNLVASYSVDQNSNADGQLGAIGWMSQSVMIPGFESVLEANTNKPFVLNTQYGTHVVLVSEKSELLEKKQVAILEKTALASKETFNNYYSQANTFASITNGTYEGYQKAVDSTKVYSHAITITEATSNYGSVDHARELTRWAFDNKAGKASNIITINNNYFFVTAVKKVNKEGYAPVNDVASIIYERLYSEKLQDKTFAEVKEKVQGATSLETIASSLGSEIENHENVSLSATNIDPAILGAALVAEEGQIFGPVYGQIGVYMIKVSNKQTGSFYTEQDANTLADQKAQYSAQAILGVMSEYDNVKDNRERFF